MVKFKFTSPKTVIYDVLRFRGWKQTDHESDWDFHWCERDWMVEIYDQIHFHLASSQKINHYRNSRELSRKDLLAKNVNKYKRDVLKAEKSGSPDLADKLNFLPVSYVLPREHALFVEQFKKYKNKKGPNLWIMKPTGRSQGRGIFVIQKISEVAKWKYTSSAEIRDDETLDVENYVIQRYISQPLLVSGRKFDLRLYVLITSFRPLEIWLYRGGFARFSNNRYNTDDIKNSFVHLTNVAIQKQSSNYDKSIGTKLSLDSLKQLLMVFHGYERIYELFKNIEDIIAMSAQSVTEVMMQDQRCFELFGYDIIIDSNLKPWVLEVNSSPALNASNQSDYEFKFKMLSNMLDVIDVEKKRDREEIRVGGFDLIFKKTKIKFHDCYLNQTFLGCRIPDEGSDKILPQKIYPPVSSPVISGTTQDKSSKRVWK